MEHRASLSAGCMTPPRWLAILNLTPDSFSDGGRWCTAEAALHHAEQLVAQGAWGLDLGAESTRPGAAPLDPTEEWARLAPVLPRLRAAHPSLILSLDTRHAEVTQRALDVGINLINDVTGFSDPAMLRIACSTQVPLIAMRSRRVSGGFFMPPYGDPGEPTADRALREMAHVRDRLLGASIPQERIYLDPGFGFGTTWSEDRALWEALPSLPERLDWPASQVCIGISRKRFTAWMAGTPDLPASARDSETFRLHMIASEWGFDLFRTHHLKAPA